MKTKKISNGDFQKQRQDVLATWPTGAAVRLDEAVAYQQAIPAAKRFAKAMSDAKARHTLLVQPRAGVALVEEHIRLLKYLETEGGADLLPTTIDAYTRQNRYAEAAKGIEKSTTSGASMLNGFPAVNHGVDGCRRVTESLTKPVQIRHGTPDARLLAEITLAGGFTSFEGGGISYNIPYVKNVPLRKSLADWQYVDRLCGYYEEQRRRDQSRAVRTAHRNARPAVHQPLGGHSRRAFGLAARREIAHVGLRSGRQHGARHRRSAELENAC